MNKTNFYLYINKNFDDKLSKYIRNNLLDANNVFKYYNPDNFTTYSEKLFWDDNDNLMYANKVGHGLLCAHQVQRVIIRYTNLFEPEKLGKVKNLFKRYEGFPAKERSMFARVIYFAMIFTDGETLSRLNKIYYTPFNIAISKLKRNKLVNEGILLKLSIKQSGMF